MRIFRKWQKVFIIKDKKSTEWTIERNNWVKAWTYTVEFIKDWNTYQEILSYWNIFKDKEEVNEKLIKDYTYEINRRERYIQENKNRMETYKKEINEIKKIIKTIK